uniref:General vesicular transport factor p115 n=1 Tax=Sinocyclocheilus grahami TaxID=75366 RepID=A0A672M305_SINGR
MNYIWEVVGRHPTGQQPTGAETIQKLCDRVASSTLLEDRRDAVRALKSLSKKYRMEVGTMAMDHLVRILQTDRADTEILGYALDTLYNIVCSDEEEEPGMLYSLFCLSDFHEMSSLSKDLYGFFSRYLVSNVVFSHSIGVSRLMDLLADSREVIRNDGLLLLQQLTKGNTAIQKIVAFENAFERLLEIITEEGSSDGGIVVEDCLLLLLNLLKNNSSNQNFFKEGSYVQKMKPWFEVGDDNSGWSAQKVTNLHLMLQLVRVMVSPVNSPGATTSCQKAMFQCGLLQQLCTILMATGVPADILTETINTVSEVIRGSEVNQDYFASVNAPSNPPRPAIVVLLMSMVNERQPFVLRCAVLYCFQCFLYKNHKGQGEIVATLLPSTIDANSISAGQLLCGGLFSADSLSNWCAAVALAHALQDNLTQKEQLLRVQLATSLGKPPVSLLQQCTNILKFYYSYDPFTSSIMFSPFSVVLYLFIGMITKAVLRSSEEEKKEEEVKKTLEQHDSIVTQYKELIREQDSQINELKEQVTSQSSQNEKLQNTITQQFSQIQQHKDQYNILKLKLGKDNQQTGNQAEAAHVNGVQPEELSQLREQLEELQRQNQLLQTQLTEKDSLITSLKAEGVPSAEGSTSEVTELQKEVELLKAQLQSQTAEITQLQSERQELLRGSETTAAVPGEDGVYTEKIAELESRLSAQTAETQKLKGEVKTLLESKELMEKELASATSTAAIMLSEKSKLQQEVQESKKEQDDLLMLLADQDQKILSLKQRLKDLGETIEDEDDLDSRDQFDDDDEEEEEEECDE